VAAKRKMTEKFLKKSVRGIVSGKSVTMGNPLMAMEYKQYSKGTE